MTLIVLIILILLIYVYIKNYNEKFGTSTTTTTTSEATSTTTTSEATSTTAGIVEATSTPSVTISITVNSEEELARKRLELIEKVRIENEQKELKRLEFIEAQKQFEEKEKQILLEEELNRIELNKTKITYPEITILKEALKENDNKLYTIRYDSLSKQDKLNELTKRLNNINYSISSLKQNPQYKASGELKFY